jgi:DUF971 family protein
MVARIRGQGKPRWYRTGLGLMAPIPESIVLHQQSRALELVYADAKRYKLSFEFLRVHSPSAEVQGHGAGQQVLQTGKREVRIDAIEPVGNYALKLVFSDGHDSGLYAWDLLHRFSQHQETMWEDYLLALQAAGASRD